MHFHGKKITVARNIKYKLLASKKLFQLKLKNFKFYFDTFVPCCETALCPLMFCSIPYVTAPYVTVENMQPKNSCFHYSSCSRTSFSPRFQQRPQLHDQVVCYDTRSSSTQWTDSRYTTYVRFDPRRWSYVMCSIDFFF